MRFPRFLCGRFRTRSWKVTVQHKQALLKNGFRLKPRWRVYDLVCCDHGESLSTEELWRWSFYPKVSRIALQCWALLRKQTVYVWDFVCIVPGNEFSRRNLDPVSIDQQIIRRQQTRNSRILERVNFEWTSTCSAPSWLINCDMSLGMWQLSRRCTSPKLENANFE